MTRRPNREFVSVHTDPAVPGVGTILLNRPPTNALTRQVYRELTSAAEEAAGRSEIAAVIRRSDCFTFVGRHRHAAGHEVAVEVNTTRFFEDGRELRVDEIEQEEINILYVALTRARAAIRLCASFEEWLRHRRLMPA